MYRRPSVGNKINFGTFCHLQLVLVKDVVVTEEGGVHPLIFATFEDHSLFPFYQSVLPLPVLDRELLQILTLSGSQVGRGKINPHCTISECP